MKLHVLQQLQQRLLDETDIRVIIMLIEPNRFKTFCIRIDSLAKSHQQQHRDAMHAYVRIWLNLNHNPNLKPQPPSYRRLRRLHCASQQR